MSDTASATPSATPAATLPASDLDAVKRQRDKVAQLLARPAVLVSASVTLDNGQTLG